MIEVCLRTVDGTVQGVALVDDDDAALVERFRWRLHNAGYAVRNCSKHGRLLMHRELLGLAVGERVVVDHINRNPLDNRRANLRLCSQAENMQNLAADAGRGVSRYRGVSFDRRRGVWVASVNVTVGAFTTEMAAAKAVVAWRGEHLPFSPEAAAA